MWAWNKEQFAAGSTDVWIFKKLTCDAVTVSFTKVCTWIMDHNRLLLLLWILIGG